MQVRRGRERVHKEIQSGAQGTNQPPRLLKLYYQIQRFQGKSHQQEGHGGHQGIPEEKDRPAAAQVANRTLWQYPSGHVEQKEEDGTIENPLEYQKDVEDTMKDEDD